ncbi:MAG: hypothetical protein IJ706_08110 [Clostridia bacterium]|nr:hypothetical protein [Clostridia bacterium]
MKKLDVKEYNSLKNEMNSRIQLMYSHNIGLTTSVFAIWAIAALFWSNYLEFILERGISEEHIIIGGAVILGILFVSPLAILLPFSARNKDNIGQMLSMAAYLIVFAETPSRISGEKDICGWESFQNKTINRDKKVLIFFNSEYLLLSIISIILLFCSAVSCISLYCLTKGAFSVCLLMIYLTIFIASVCVLCLTFYFSDNRKFNQEKIKVINNYANQAMDPNNYIVEENELELFKCEVEKIISEIPNTIKK